MLSHFPNLSISCLTANALLLKLLVQFVIKLAWICIDIRSSNAAWPFFDTPRGWGHNLGVKGTPLHRLWDPQWSLLCHKLSKIGNAASLEHIIRYYCTKSGVNRTKSLAGRGSQRFGTRSCFSSFASLYFFSVSFLWSRWVYGYLISILNLTLLLKYAQEKKFP